ncbi:hypothetical protein ACFL5K_03965 [Gemmatimonadota bacterium]
MQATRIAFFSFVIFSASLLASTAEPEKAEELFLEAREKLAGQDTSQALTLLNRALATDSKHYPSLLLRGRLFIGAGDGKQAVRDFKKALAAKDKRIRLKCYLGLADTYRIVFKKNYSAEKNCRKAFAIDPHNSEALYCRAQIGFSYGMTDGYNMARRALAKLLCIDPGYRDAYRLWREEIKDQSSDETRRVNDCLEPFLVAHPENASWWVDIAWDRYRLGETQKALETLGKLERASPGFHSPERSLAEARCSLSLGDTMSFQDLYQQALRLAEQTGDFSRLFSEAQTIFSSDDFREWADLGEDNSARVNFLQIFWITVDPDPLTPFNTRLVEHYIRLAHAEKKYYVINPHSLYYNSKNYNLLTSFQSELYYYDSNIIFDRSRHLPLDARGLLYVRFGPPQLIKTEHQMPNLKMSNPAEVWYYNGAPFYFEKMTGAGGQYMFRPYFTGRIGNMMKAMEKQRYRENNYIDAEYYFSAQFLSADGLGVEWEFYQDEEPADSAAPQAAVAVFDSTGAEVSRRESELFRVSSSNSNLWLAVHRATVAPGNYSYGMRMQTDQCRWAGRGRMELRPFDPEHIELSAIVLGPAPDPELPAYVRNGVRLMPRPSCKFRPGEPIMVYLELYGLKTGRESRRSYKEWIDVIRLEDGESKIKKFVGQFIHMLTFSGRKPVTTVTLSFDRTLEKDSGPAVEVFTLDTSPLAKGSYRLLIETRDNVDQYWDSEEAFFEIED